MTLLLQLSSPSSNHNFSSVPWSSVGKARSFYRRTRIRRPKSSCASRFCLRIRQPLAYQRFARLGKFAYSSNSHNPSLRLFKCDSQICSMPKSSPACGWRIPKRKPWLEMFSVALIISSPQHLPNTNPVTVQTATSDCGVSQMEHWPFWGLMWTRVFIFATPSTPAASSQLAVCGIQLQAC